MNPLATSITRTMAGYLVATLLSLPSAGPLLQSLGVDSMSARQQLTAVFIFLVGTIYYVVARGLEHRWPALGRLLGVPSPPSYGVTGPSGLDSQQRTGAHGRTGENRRIEKHARAEKAPPAQHRHHFGLCPAHPDHPPMPKPAPWVRGVARRMAIASPAGNAPSPRRTAAGRHRWEARLFEHSTVRPIAAADDAFALAELSAVRPVASAEGAFAAAEALLSRNEQSKTPVGAQFE